MHFSTAACVSQVTQITCGRSLGCFFLLNGSVIHERNGDNVIGQCLFWDMINDLPTRIGYFARSRETLSSQRQQNMMQDIKLFHPLVE